MTSKVLSNGSCYSPFLIKNGMKREELRYADELKVFDYADIDKDGIIKDNEYNRMVCADGHYPGEKITDYTYYNENSWYTVDTDKDGEITKDELDEYVNITLATGLIKEEYREKIDETSFHDQKGSFVLGILGVTTSFLAQKALSTKVPAVEEYVKAGYTKETAKKLTNILAHKDVMTACVKDTHKQASKQGVNLTMQHRLSALDFVGYSYVDAKAVNELNKNYPGWTNIPEDTPVEIIIDELTITLENLAYNKVCISLDESGDLDLQNEGTQAMIPSNTASTTTYNFTYVSESLDTLGFPNSKTTILSRKLNGDKVNGCPMILIPQDTELNCTVDITYRIKAGDLISNITYTENDSEEINGLAEGVYNYFLLEFTKTGVHLRAEQSAQWDEKNVDHQFE